MFNGVGDGIRQGNGKVKMVGITKGGEGGARRGNTTTSRHSERMRGWHNERMAKEVMQ